jgi:hypothetical protein
MKKSLYFILVPIFLGVSVATMSHYILADDTPEDVAAVRESYLNQSAALTRSDARFSEIETLFATLAHEQGGAYAFSVLKEAELPFGLDTHLLGHTIGEILYEQEGMSGMSLCTHDFRNACSHTMVIGALMEDGTGALPKIREACHDAPGGTGAYTMCFHGLGHGVLAFNGYSMERTIQMCDQLGTPEFNNREAVECFGGAVMEIIGGGGHDREIWSKQRAEYLQPEDPFGICKESFVTDKYRAICYNYMTPYVYEASGADMSAPGEKAFTKVFQECEKIPQSDTELRASCFGGQGKEFIGLAVGRNFSSSMKPTTSQLQQMQEWCDLATSEDGYAFCSQAVVNSLYWGGENFYTVPLEYCSLQPDSSNQRSCVSQMISNVDYYMNNPEYRQSFCNAVPEASKLECTQTLL